MKFKLRSCNKITESFDFQDVDVLDDGSFVDLEGRPVELQKTDRFGKSGIFDNKNPDDIVDISEFDPNNVIPLDWKQKTDLNNSRFWKSNKSGHGEQPSGGNSKNKENSDESDDPDIFKKFDDTTKKANKNNNQDDGQDDGQGTGQDGGQDIDSQSKQSQGGKGGKPDKEQADVDSKMSGNADIFKLFNDAATAANSLNFITKKVSESADNKSKESIIIEKINSVNNLVQALKLEIAKAEIFGYDGLYERSWEEFCTIRSLVDELNYTGSNTELSSVVNSLKSYIEPLENIIKNVQITLLDRAPQYCPLIQDEDTGEYYIQIGDDWIRWDDYYAI